MQFRDESFKFAFVRLCCALVDEVSNDRHVNWAALPYVGHSGPVVLSDKNSHKTKLNSMVVEKVKMLNIEVFFSCLKLCKNEDELYCPLRGKRLGLKCHK